MTFTVWIWLLHTTAVLVLCSFRQASLFSLLSQGQVHVVDVDGFLELTCSFRFKDFDLFENPVIWTKQQLDELTPVNMMGNILEPFLHSNKFEVLFEEVRPNYKSVLRISDLTIEDSGNYSCEIRGKRSVILGVVQHTLLVKAPAEQLFIRFNQTSDYHHPNNNLVPTITLTEVIAHRVSCVSAGGLPPSPVYLFVGSRNLSSTLSTTVRYSLEGRRGFRVVSSRVESSSENFRVTSEDDGKLLSCVTDGSSIVTTSSVRLDVLYRPVVECLQTTAHLREQNVAVTCHIRAKPQLSTLFWITDHNGTKVTEGQTKDFYWTLVRDRGNHEIETKLFISEVSTHHYRAYTIFAENSLGVSTGDAQLQPLADAGMTSKSPVITRKEDLFPIYFV